MCIAAIIKEPISREYLHEMNKDNPHGGGVAWLENGFIRFERGLDDAAIWDLQQNGALTYPYFLHFRWATHGGVVPQLTHPFPVGPRALFGELSGYATSVFMHNGVWNGYAAHLHKVLAPKALVDAASDTAVAAYLLGTDPEFIDKLDNIPWATAIMAVDDEGKLVLGEFGHSWVDHGPNRYSNLGWLPASEWWAGNKHKYPGVTYTQPSHSAYDRGGWDWEQREHWEASDWSPTEATPLNRDTPTFEDPAWEANKDVEPFVDDYLTTSSKERRAGAREVIKCFDNWEEYVRSRYGDEIANEIAKDEGVAPEDCDDPDLISEEAAVVNAYLERLERKMA